MQAPQQGCGSCSDGDGGGGAGANASGGTAAATTDHGQIHREKLQTTDENGQPN